MTTEDIIRWARQCAVGETVIAFTLNQLKDFAKRVAHDERNHMIADGWRQCAQGQKTSQHCSVAEQARQDAERHKASASMWRNKAYELGGTPLPWDADEMLEKVIQAERARACRIVTGLCISDNNAREICEAIRAEEPEDENPSFG
jgi:hypothetical protein